MRSITVNQISDVNAFKLLTFLTIVYGLQAFTYDQHILEVVLNTEWNIGKFEGEVNLFMENNGIKSDFKVAFVGKVLD